MQKDELLDAWSRNVTPGPLSMDDSTGRRTIPAALDQYLRQTQRCRRCAKTLK